MRHLFLLLPLALAACGNSTTQTNFFCRTTAEARASTPGLRQAVYDSCTSHLYENETNKNR